MEFKKDGGFELIEQPIDIKLTSSRYNIEGKDKIRFLVEVKESVVGTAGHGMNQSIIQDELRKIGADSSGVIQIHLTENQFTYADEYGSERQYMKVE